MKKNIILIEKSNVVFHLLKEKFKTCFKNKINVLRYNTSSQCSSNNDNCDLYIYDYENSHEDFREFMKYLKLKSNDKKQTLIFSSMLNDENYNDLDEFKDEFIKFSKYNDLDKKIKETLKIIQ